MTVELQKIKFKNFMSYGNSYTEFNFQKGLDIISGSNGNGKSVLVAETLTYALFGKAYRKIKLSSLVNDKNNQDLVVELTFNIKEDEYKIIRGQKPNVFEIYKNKELIPQKATTKEYQKYLENYIIKMNENTFRQIVVLGANISSSKPFLELSPAEKEDVFNSVIDTKIFIYMLDIIKTRNNLNKTYKLEYEYKLKLLTQSITSEENNINRIKAKNDEYLKHSEDKVNEIDLKLKDLDDKLVKIKSILEKSKLLTVAYNDKKQLIQDNLTKINDINYTILNYKSELESLSTSPVCKECGAIQTEVTLSSTELQENISSNEDKLKELQDIDLSLNEELSDIQTKILKVKVYINTRKDIEDSILSLTKEKNEILSNTFIEIDDSTLISHQEEYKETKVLLDKVNDEMNKLATLRKLLTNKDLKGAIINKQLPILNKFINQYIEKFSTGEFNMIIGEDFSEKILTSRGVHKEFSQLSNGQKMRLTFSLIFAFLKFIEEKNAVNINVLIADEILDSSIDTEGREELINILNTEFSSKNVVIISHNPEIKDKEEIFNRKIDIITLNGFSKANIHDKKENDES